MMQTRPGMPQNSSHLKKYSHFRGRWSFSRLDQGKNLNQISTVIITAADFPKPRVNQVPFSSELRLANLKLKGIDGRAPPGVEPVA